MLANWRKFAMWGSLVAAALGALSAFENVVPALVRLSLIMHGLAWVYRAARDWLFGWVIGALAAVGIEIRITEPVRDAILIIGLVLAALNWESTRRTGRNLFLDLFRDVLDLFHGDIEQRNSLALQGLNNAPESLKFMRKPVLLLLASLFFAVVSIYFAAVGDRWGVLPLGYCSLYYAFSAWMRSRRGGTPKFLDRLHLITIVPLFLFAWPFAVLFEGRRAVFVALALLGALIALNALMLLYVDPMLASPPPWLQDFIDANPQSLGE